MSTPPLSVSSNGNNGINGFSGDDTAQKCFYMVALENAHRLGKPWRARLIAVLTATEESKTSSVSQVVLSPRRSGQVDELHRAVLVGDLERVKKMLQEANVDVNAIMSIAAPLTPEEQGRKNNTTPSSGIGYPQPPSINIFSEDRSIQVPPIYYALEQAVTVRNNTNYEFIFLALLNYKNTKLNLKRQALKRDPFEGFTILHLAALKAPKSLLEKILKEGNRVELNQPVENSDLGKYDKFTALDLAVVRVSEATTFAELKVFIDLYELLEKAGCKHAQRKKTEMIQNPPKTPALFRQRGRSSSQTDLDS